ncbi:MAG TPA: metal-sulfur cluster assembly factor [Ktedonobacterales bacterium]|jgi:metal-sulfur cluster biosynthetic enzyme
MNEDERAATRARIYKALHTVLDPELGVNVVDLGLVYDVQVREDGYITVTMTLTTPGCPMHESLGHGVARALGKVPGVTGGDLQLVWSPPWDPSMMTPEGKAALGWSA